MAAKSWPLKRMRFTFESVDAPIPITTSISLTSSRTAPQLPIRMMFFTPYSAINSCT
ncbi:Uncharacterised protein [Vibrio cholerae]|nr:Uncharacterised protein [Vibrio cholerae]